MPAAASVPIRPWAGLAIALALISIWSVSLVALLGWRPEGGQLVLIPLAIAWQTFLYTGLFITAHEAMHGLVTPGRPRLNHAVGALAVALFALFSYRRLCSSHLAHHRAPCSEADPDFHAPARTGFWRWYGRFFAGYSSLWQIAGMGLVFNLLNRGLHVPQPQLLLFWVVPSLLSSVQLFYFGTYRPHREPAGGYRAPHFATSSDWPAIWSFLSCYHFGYHWEHHAYPQVAWWQLPRLRRQLEGEGG